MRRRRRKKVINQFRKFKSNTPLTRTDARRVDQKKDKKNISFLKHFLISELSFGILNFYVNFFCR